MERRTRPAYQAVFQRLKLLSPFFDPESVMSDYELALMGALRIEFPNADSDGCLFHFVVSSVKHAKYELGLVIMIRENPVVRRIVQLCCGIPLAPPQMMRDALRAIAAEARLTLFYDDLIPYFDYLWYTWLSGPRYESLSVCGSVHRTNNACESFNHVLGSELGEHHVNVYRFLECLSNIEDTAQTDILTLYEGRNPGRPRKTSSLANDARIQLWTRNLLDGYITIREFIHCVSPTLHGLFEEQVRAGP
ncbi:uncharacterized protein LOC117640240 [Thrips palmi]|uniref:Uncharacterized protein LOC117640240 n=1 Tax=Thrips palmi TaxID=161013 RepID=A0A6P8Y791_THRPL|nr:uncharacterized protein LOC117640240 [Thrips palmi]